MSEAPSYTISFYYRKILVPVDGSETSLKALMIAADLATRYGSRIVVVNAKPRGTGEPDDPLIKAKERLKGLPVNASYKSIEYDPKNESPQAAVIKEIVSEGYDLVILGARGKTWLSEISLGGFALSLIVNAPVSVFIVR